LDVQPGWQVLISSSVLARPLVEEVQRGIARRGAYAITKLAFDQTDVPTWGELAWAQEAPPELLSELAPLFRSLLEQVDAMASIVCPENTRAGTALEPELHALLRRSVAPIMPRIMA